MAVGYKGQPSKITGLFIKHGQRADSIGVQTKQLNIFLKRKIDKMLREKGKWAVNYTSPQSII